MSHGYKGYFPLCNHDLWLERGEFHAIFQLNSYFLWTFLRSGVQNAIFMGKSNAISLFATARILKGHQVLSFVRSKVVLFMFRKGFLKIFFLQVPFFLVLACFRFTDFQFFHKHKKWRPPLLCQLFIKAIHISTMWTQTKWSRVLWLSNDKASYVAKEDIICLLSFAKEATLNEQWIKPGVPLV